MNVHQASLVYIHYNIKMYLHLTVSHHTTLIHIYVYVYKRIWTATRMEATLIIAICQRKGGSGKTTLTTCLACELQLRGFSTLIIDADPQGTATDWRAVADESIEEKLPSVLALPKETLHRKGQLDRVSKNFDYVLIDCPPALGAITRSALMACHVALLPTRPNAADIWALDGMIELVHEAQNFNEKLSIGLILLTQRPARSKGAELGVDHLSKISQEEGIDIFNHSMSTRVTYSNAMLSGSAPTLYEPKGKASQEVQAITDELLERISQ
jgi:chromosome partitioning protein